MIDTHCHLADPQFNKDLSSVLQRAQEAGVQWIVNAGYDIATSQTVIKMSHATKWLLPAIGIHPNEAAAESLQQVPELISLADAKETCAIGETGLDYYRGMNAKHAQEELFRAHIDLARKKNLPLLIHTRSSIDDAISILKEEKYFKGVFHCYTGTLKQAYKAIDMGFYLGFGGMLTFSRTMREVFNSLPADRIVLETDAPFLAPIDHRGKRNEPAYIFETLREAATLLDMNPGKLEGIVDKNALALFSLSDVNL